MLAMNQESPSPCKASRTIFCYGFDPALLTTYSSPNEIKGILVAQGWKPRDIIIMNSKKSFKIIMETSQEARNYINALGTSIGGIQLLKENKEHEIDPSISQCWACGRLNPNHNSNTCPNPKVCIKCNSSTHQIFDCPLPKSHADMSQDQKNVRHCIPCGSTGDHTSLDHRSCPTKRKIVQDRIKDARAKRNQEEIATKRDRDLIQQTLELSNNEAWPALRQNQEQHQKTSTIVILALIDESANPGNFQAKLDKGMQDNGLPLVKYTPDPKTAEMIRDTLFGNNFAKPAKPTVTLGTGQFTLGRVPPPGSPAATGRGFTFRTHPTPPSGPVVTGGAFSLPQPSFSVGPTATGSALSTKNKRDLHNASISNANNTETESKKSKIIPTHVTKDIPVPNFKQALLNLSQEIKIAPLHLTAEAIELLPKGKTSAKLSFTIRELKNLFDKDRIITDVERRNRIIKEIDIIEVSSPPYLF